MGTDRITTREAAKLFGCLPNQVTVLLRAANISPERCGGAFLWDAAQVSTLLDKLKTTKQEGAK